MRDHAEELKMLQEQLDRDNVNEINFMIKEASDKAKKEGLAEGYAAGARENLEANVKAMFDEKISIDKIAKIVNLSVVEVEKILNK